MAMLDHWHPVLASQKLKREPVGLQLAGRLICLFRDSHGTAQAIDDVCPHRRLKLSVGTVVGDRIQCKYHGWTFDGCGHGESPSTPRMHTCTESFHVREEHGYCWVKSAASIPQFPEINTDNFYHLGNFQHDAPTPLELTVDNFNEIEHSATVHDTFGYDLDRMDEVKVRFEHDDEKFHVLNHGPTKTLNPILRRLLGIRKGDIFHDEWTTRFSPVYSVFDHWWTSPDGSREAMIRWRLYIFFTPVTESRTTVTSFVYAKSRYPGSAGGLRFAKYWFRREIDREVRQDIALLHNLADHRVTVEGMKLSRFDKVLGLTRERIARIYRGENHATRRIPLAA